MIWSIYTSSLATFRVFAHGSPWLPLGVVALQPLPKIDGIILSTVTSFPTHSNCNCAASPLHIWSFHSDGCRTSTYSFLIAVYLLHLVLVCIRAGCNFAFPVSLFLSILLLPLPPFFLLFTCFRYLVFLLLFLPCLFQFTPIFLAMSAPDVTGRDVESCHIQDGLLIPGGQ